MEQRNHQSFDQYFQEHRQQLDVEIPGAQVWKEVEARLDGKTIPLWSRLPLWRAAAVLLMIAAGAAALWQLKPEITKGGVADIPALTHIEHQQNWAAEEATFMHKEDSLLAEIQHFELYQHPEAESYMQRIQALNARLADGHMATTEGEKSSEYDVLRGIHQEKLSLLTELLTTLQQGK